MTEPQIINIDFTKYLFDNQKAIFIDARDQEDFKQSHIENAINIPYEEYEAYDSLIYSLDVDYPVIVYCNGKDCDLSIYLGDLLFDDYEFNTILIFDGGFPEWLDKKYPIDE